MTRTRQVTRERALWSGTRISVALCAATLLGCGQDGPQRFELSGKVTYRGQPVPSGSIVFEPDAAKGNDGPQGMAPIQNGMFDTARGGRGTVGGPHLVTILGCDGVNVSETSPQGKPLFEPFITSVEIPKKRATLDLTVP